MNQTLLYRSLRNALLVHFPKRSIPSRNCEDVMCAEPPEEVVPPPVPRLTIAINPVSPFEFSAFNEDINFQLSAAGGTGPYVYDIVSFTPAEADLGLNLDAIGGFGDVAILSGGTEAEVTFRVTDANSDEAEIVVALRIV
jgi:hypothetical protein